MRLENSKVITEPYRSLIGHASRITGLSWNANNNYQLASASYDGTVQVCYSDSSNKFNVFYKLEKRTR